MHAQFNATIEDAIFASDVDGMDIDIHLRGDDTADIHQHAYAVDTLKTDGSIEEQAFVHVPLGIKDAIAEAGLQLSSYGTGALVNLYLVLAVNEAKDVIARDRVTAVLELLLRDIIVVDEDRLFAVELLRNHE